MLSATSKRSVTNLALLLALVALAACSSGKKLHGTHEDLPGGHVIQMQRMSPTFGWVVTDRRFVSTKDAGKTWNDLTPVDAPGNSIRAAFFSDESHVWCAAFTGKAIEVYRSDTKGRSWKKTVLAGDYSTGVKRVRIDIAGGKVGTLYVEYAGKADAYSTFDGGVSWHGESTPRAALDAFPSPATPGPFTNATGLPDQIESVSWPDDKHGWAVSKSGCPKLNGGCEPQRLFATEDGGATWTRLIP